MRSLTRILLRPTLSKTLVISTCAHYFGLTLLSWAYIVNHQTEAQVQRGNSALQIELARNQPQPPLTLLLDLPAAQNKPSEQQVIVTPDSALMGTRQFAEIPLLDRDSPAPLPIPKQESFAELATRLAHDLSETTLPELTEPAPPSPLPQPQETTPPVDEPIRVEEPLEPAPQQTTTGGAPELGSPSDTDTATTNRPPIYPDEAARRRWEGRVVLDLHLDAAGHVVEVEIFSSSGYPILDAAAVNACRSWRLTPDLREGRRGAGVERKGIRFRIPDTAR